MIFYSNIILEGYFFIFIYSSCSFRSLFEALNSAIRILLLENILTKVELLIIFVHVNIINDLEPC